MPNYYDLATKRISMHSKDRFRCQGFLRPACASYETKGRRGHVLERFALDSEEIFRDEREEGCGGVNDLEVE